ncbi:MAG: MXAN_6577-like cysteine-rich protein [Polyangiales bacterium]
MVGGDAGPADTGPLDTGPLDTGPLDTGPLDTGPADTGPLDTGPADTGPVDTGPADTGPMCTASETVCDGRCVDTQTDASHCGACGTPCAAGSACRAGACELVCPAGQTVCAGACVTLASDPSHCGACGTACAAGQTCAAGACACPAGTTLCGDRCVDTQSDAAHCGACTTACSTGEVCAMGACRLSCPAGQTACGSACVTLATDALHCGACSTACAAGQSCVMGACACPAGTTLCGGRCVDTQTSTAHCGACDNACALDGATAACVAGACRVAGCDAGRGDCDADRTNGCEVTLSGDVMNCGACGRACAVANATATCAMGACAVASCAAGFADCNASAADGCEVSTASDASNCGGCGTVCPSGVCASGACVAFASCQAIKTAQPSAADGRYTIDPDGSGPGAPFEVYCDMTTMGGGWTYVATVTNNGDGANAGHWLVTTPTPNAWESTSATFGTLDPTANADYRSLAFHAVPGRALMVTHRNLFLLATDGACLADRSLQAALARLDWTCAGSQSFTAHPACTNACVIASQTPRAGDLALLAGTARARLYLKAGEADGAQDTNRDRAYISTSYRDNVDYPTGLGAFCSGASCNPRTGEADVNDRSDAITPAAGTEFYGLWVR